MGKPRYLILVVDDDPGSLQTIVSNLSDMGHDNVYTAPNGKIGLELADEFAPDLILTDWDMPVKDGLKLVKALKGNTLTRNIPVIMLTAVRITPHDMQESFNAGIHDYLRKPFDKIEFSARVSNALRLSQSEIALREQNSLISSQYEELSNVYDNLSKLDEAKTRHFQDIAHDLKSPISALIGFSKILKDEYEDELTKAVSEITENILICGNKLNHLSEEIRDLIAHEVGSVELKKTGFSIDELISKVIRVFGQMAKSRQISLNYRPKKEGLILNADLLKIEKVFYNLVANAIQYSNPGDHVLIESERKEENLAISISDNGPGIPEYLQAIIFNRFERLNEDESNPSRSGLGIGLSLANEIIKLHKGEIVVDSYVGKGTTFKISLPINESSEKDVLEAVVRNDNYPIQFEEVAQTISVSIPLKKEQNKTCILVIDDNKLMRSMIKDILSGQYHLIEANNGEEALKLLKMYEVEMILTDLMMPVLNGFELLDILNETPEYQTIPCIIFSARDTEEDRLRGLQLGVNNFLSKPFNSEELKLRIQNLIKQKKDTSLNLPETFSSYNSSNAKKLLMKRLRNLVLDRIDDPNLGVSDLASEIAVSQRNLFRFIKEANESTPLEFIKQIRFQFAKELIEKKKVTTMSQASQSIGISNVTKFKDQFENRFGYLPKL